MPVAAAFLIEFPFYLLAGFDGPRTWLDKFGNIKLAGVLTVTGILPWLIYSIPTGEFRPEALAVLLIITTAVSFWYIALPPGAVTDAVFLVIPAAVFVAKIFEQIYASPLPKVQLGILGQLMLIRTAALAILLVRKKAGGEPVDVEFRFWPERREWLIGIRFFTLLIPFAGLAYWGLGLVQLRAHPYNALQAAGTFLGILWVVALSEEFFFRGLIQQWIGKWTGSPVVALIIASVLFGSVHLGFNHRFPNWRFSLVAAIAGVFYGLAWKTAKSIQASMVAHALTVTLWRVFLQ
ncbi:MAG TPA: type II CAAX endopeptidase family protein [Bryobacteraceae bacterium]|nr:type II CAAX endopeptidase family protein [Bryobacteraceae bacterium]